MITVSVTTVNGLALPATQKRIIELQRVVKAKANGTGLYLLYANSFDRRDRPDELLITENAATVGITGVGATFVALTAYVGAGTETQYYNPAFIDKIVDTRVLHNGSFVNCVQVDFVEGAFLQRTVFAAGSVGNSGGVTVVTTTTTPEPETTTTTPEPETTTTTPETPPETTTTTPQG